MRDMIYLSLAATVLFIILATGRFGLHPFLVLVVAAFLAGVLLGIPVHEIAPASASGFGGTLGAIGIVIAAGAVIGSILEQSGGANVLAEQVLSWVGIKRASLALGGAGAVVSIPVFCDSGFVLLSPVIDAVGRSSRVPKAELAVTTAMGLYATHVFVPPTPGPVAAAGEVAANIPTVMLLGALISVPVLFASRAYAKFAAPRFASALDGTDGTQIEQREAAHAERPSTAAAFAPILVPIALMALPTSASALGLSGTAVEVATLIGHPITAMLLGVLVALRLLRDRGSASAAIDEALRSAGPIVLITGAGGALGGVLKASSLSSEIAQALNGANFGSFALLLPFAVAAALKTSIGSSTVAIVTTASLLAPFLGALGLQAALGPELIVLAIGAGAMTVSHANDSYFWVVSQFSGMSTSQAYRTHTVATLVAGVTGILGVVLLGWLAGP